MAILKDLLYKVSIQSVFGDTSMEVNNIVFDSRLVNENDLFVAVIGTQSDGHEYIQQVVEKGVKAIVCEVFPEQLLEGITYVQVHNSAQALGIISSNYYHNPSSKLKLVGVTGTNGKTSTVTILHRLFRKLGYQVGLLSTVENRINETIYPSTHTTPDPVQLNRMLAEMLSHNCTHVFMEVSSHAAVQQRIAGLDFSGAVFTNITHDHLDYHKTFDEYIRAKKMFFDALSSSAFSLVNIDDKRGTVMQQNTKSVKYSFAIQNSADFKAKIKSNSFHGLEIEIDNKDIWFKQIGKFNAYNLLGVYATAVLLDEDKEEVLMQLSNIDTAKGRFEVLRSVSGIIAIVDYAHTPDALQNVLDTINDLRQGHEKIITVVGCGGNRDKAKRPVMAGIAAKNSNKVILTSDNPRTESPELIIQEMEAGVGIVEKKKVLSITDRKEAIKTACSLASSGDIILIAGKGHENYQEINGVKHHFDDQEEVLQIFQLLGI
ncbi:MAG: UDP-N-acetylmuramoyl-L-alanyl-D-glutamate--2,6-diaminopimelate ligase [Cytophagales bacterium]|nr:MAG: UDP-N-acetylmuramoyl-L-alanyl-D-glutamate--2,6-diaminopimelate ligase [Cytophagales bacterium]